jgi:succinate dehydrogenase/fumarate reductase iron-sulfur protein
MPDAKGAERVTVQIARSNPQAEEPAHIESYQVALEEKSSVLNALTHISEHIDPSLAFYSSCRIGKCMGCQIMVNGKAAFACTAPLEGDITVAPLKGFAVIKDLVVKRKTDKKK